MKEEYNGIQNDILDVYDIFNTSNVTYASTNSKKHKVG